MAGSPSDTLDEQVWTLVPECAAKSFAPHYKRPVSRILDKVTWSIKDGGERTNCPKGTDEKNDVSRENKKISVSPLGARYRDEAFFAPVHLLRL